MSISVVAFEAKKPLEIIKFDLKGPGAGEVLVEIRATGICPTDAYTLDDFDSGPAGFHYTDCSTFSNFTLLAELDYIVNAGAAEPCQKRWGLASLAR